MSECRPKELCVWRDGWRDIHFKWILTLLIHLHNLKNTCGLCKSAEYILRLLIFMISAVLCLCAIDFPWDRLTPPLFNWWFWFICVKLSLRWLKKKKERKLAGNAQMPFSENILKRKWSAVEEKSCFSLFVPPVMSLLCIFEERSAQLASLFHWLMGIGLPGALSTTEHFYEAGECWKQGR